MYASAKAVPIPYEVDPTMFIFIFLRPRIIFSSGYSIVNSTELLTPPRVTQSQCKIQFDPAEMQLG